MCCPPVCLPNAQGLFRLLREFMVQLQPCREQYVQIRSDRQSRHKGQRRPGGAGRAKGLGTGEWRLARLATGRVSGGCKATFVRARCMCMEMGEALVRRHTRCRARHRALFDWSSGSQGPAAQLLVYAGSTVSLCRDGIRQDSAYGCSGLS